MFDLATADIKQLESIYAELAAKMENPFEICKMAIELDITDLFEWIDKRLARDQIAFAARRSGYMLQIQQHFDELDRTIRQRVELSRSREQTKLTRAALPETSHDRGTAKKEKKDHAAFSHK
jgi:hypothetical protein